MRVVPELEAKLAFVSNLSSTPPKRVGQKFVIFSRTVPRAKVDTGGTLIPTPASKRLFGFCPSQQVYAYRAIVTAYS